MTRSWMLMVSLRGIHVNLASGADINGEGEGVGKQNTRGRKGRNTCSKNWAFRITPTNSM